jgi:hypothetical protein
MEGRRQAIVLRWSLIRELADPGLKGCQSGLRLYP